MGGYFKFLKGPVSIKHYLSLKIAPAPNRKSMHATLVTIKLQQLKASKAKTKDKLAKGYRGRFFIWILEYSNDSSVSVSACSSA